MKNKSLKSLLASLTLASSLIFAHEAIAQTDKSATKISEQLRKDQDLKIAIEELRKKYPISLLDKKKKTYKEGQKINIDDYSTAEIKAAFLNADRNFISRKIELGDFVTNSKGVRVVEKVDNPKPNTGYIQMSEELIVKNQQELIVIEEACKKLDRSNVSKLNKKWRDLFYSTFSDDAPIDVLSYSYKYVSEEAQQCFGSVGGDE